MTALVLRILIYAAIAAAIYFGVRSILKDWRNRFRELDKTTRAKHLSERKRADVVELEQGSDGVFRPRGRAGDEDGRPRA